MSLRSSLLSSTIVVIGIFSTIAEAQPDFGYYSRNGDDDRYWVTGVADHLTEADKNRYKQVRSEMNRYRFNGVRKTLASLLDHVNKHPDSNCKDNYTGGNTSYLKCEYGNPQKSKSFGGIMSYDVNGVLNKNVDTPEEIHAEERRLINERYKNQLQSTNAGDSSNGKSSSTTKAQTQNGYTTTGNSKNSGSGVYRLPSSKSSSYQSYISKHVAPGRRSSSRPDMLVFSNGDAPVVDAPPSNGESLDYTPTPSQNENTQSE